MQLKKKLKVRAVELNNINLKNSLKEKLKSNFKIQLKSFLVITHSKTIFIQTKSYMTNQMNILNFPKTKHSRQTNI